MNYRVRLCSAAASVPYFYTLRVMKSSELRKCRVISEFAASLAAPFSTRVWFLFGFSTKQSHVDLSAFFWWWWGGFSEWTRGWGVTPRWGPLLPPVFFSDETVLSFMCRGMEEEEEDAAAAAAELRLSSGMEEERRGGVSLLINQTAKKVTSSRWSGVTFLMLTLSFTTP